MDTDTKLLTHDMITSYYMTVWWSPSNKCWFAHAENGPTKSGEYLDDAVKAAMYAVEGFAKDD